MAVAEAVITGLQYYAAIGAIVAAAFLLIGIDRVDPSSRGSYLFRVLIAPGLIGLWPLVLWRWLALERSGEA